MLGFRKRLEERQKESNTLLCVGLDPLEEKIPPHLLRKHKGNVSEAIFEWMRDIVDSTAFFASMFKFQIAYYSAVKRGERSLQLLIRYIQERHPNIPIFLDCKRGDIGRTQIQYRKEIFTKFAADGANFSPYMGSDCMKVLVDLNYPERALVGLAYTSNPAARQIQDKLTPRPDGKLEPFWLSVVRDTLGWAKEFGVLDNAGLVMAAAHKSSEDENVIISQHLVRARLLVGNEMWFLIPGIGTQKGFVADTVNTAFFGPGSIAISSSSGITNASNKIDYAKAAAGKAEKLRDDIRINHGYMK